MDRHPFAEKIWKFVVSTHIALYRLLKGRFVGKYTILLTTVGRKSGIKRTRALLSINEGGDFIVIASYGGSTKHPDWYLNLQAKPQVTVEDHGRVLECTAITVTDDADYKQLWDKMVAIYPPYNSYQQHTSRTIPVVRLRPIQNS